MKNYLINKKWMDQYSNIISIIKFHDKLLVNYPYNKKLILSIEDNKIYIKGQNIYVLVKNNKIIWSNRTIWYKKIYSKLNMYYTLPYGPFYILPNDHFIVEHMKTGYSWESNTIMKLRTYLKKCTNVIDIGAHIG